MFDKVKELLRLYHAGDWKGEVKLILTLIADNIDMFTPEPSPIAGLSAMTKDELCNELERMNNDPAAAAFGDRFKLFLPILMELLKKFLLG